MHEGRFLSLHARKQQRGHTFRLGLQTASHPGKELAKATTRRDPKEVRSSVAPSAACWLQLRPCLVSSSAQVALTVCNFSIPAMVHLTVPSILVVVLIAQVEQPPDCWHQMLSTVKDLVTVLTFLSSNPRHIKSNLRTHCGLSISANRKNPHEKQFEPIHTGKYKSKIENRSESISQQK